MPQFDLMAAGFEIFSSAFGDAVFHCHVAAIESVLGEARSFERGLNIHLVIGNVGDELRVRLGLIESAHDSEGDALIAARHEAGNDRVQRALVAGEGIWRRWIKREESAAILQDEPSSVCHDA